MGSEGYLINQFIVAQTNKRTDQWGGSYENRIRFPTCVGRAPPHAPLRLTRGWRRRSEIVKAVRQACGPDFIIVYRLSMLDLVKDGSSWAEIVQLGKAVEAAGATIINTCGRRAGPPARF